MVRIRLLGPMSFDGVSCGLRIEPRARALLALLLMRWPRRVSRARLLDLLWPDQSEAAGQHCLSTALWRLRTALSPVDGLMLEAPRNGDIGIALSTCAEIDLVLFEAAVSGVLKVAMARRPSHLHPDEAARLESGLALYQGELLEGFDGEWVAYDRRRLHETYLDGLRLLGAHYVDMESLDRAGACFHEILRWDPLREDIHRQLMALRDRQGRRGQALDQFRTCSESLRSELGVDASQETRRLLARILQTGSGADKALAGSQDLGEALVRMSEALQEAAGACAWLIDALARSNAGVDAPGRGTIRSAQDRATPTPDC